MLFQTVTNLHAQCDVIERRRYGAIEVVDGQLVGIHLRPWPKLASLLGVMLWGNARHRRSRGNRIVVYYNQPLRYSKYLAITYVISTSDCTLSSIAAARHALEAIAQIKQIDALLCDAWNTRISTRLLARWGWQEHAPRRWHRNFIKRLYLDANRAIQRLPS